jgi:ABC-type multidrug transport system fused ATPase/permease subunit
MSIAMPQHDERVTGKHRAADKHMMTGLLLTFLRPYAWQASLVVTLLALQAIANLYLPNLYASIVNTGVVDGNIGYIWRTGGLMLGITCAIGITAIATAYWGSRVATAAAADIRAVIYRRVQAFSAQEMNRFGIPSLITRNTNDVDQVQLFLGVTLALLVPAVITCVGGVIMAVRESAALSLLLVVVMPVIALSIAWALTAVLPLARSIQAKVDRINQVVREQITGVRVIRAFSQTDSEQRRFDDANVDLTGTMLRTTRILALISPVLTILLCLSSVGVVWFGGHLVSEGSIPIGNIGAFLSYILLVLFAVLIAGGAAFQLPRSAASAERIRQVIYAVPALRDPDCPESPARVCGAVEFRGVTFGYPGSERPVLQNLNLAIRPGQTAAIIGGIGSGKSTLINLIPRFIDATRGIVLVNEADVRDQSAERLRSTIGLVPQTPFLFRGTVADNLRFGAPEAAEEQLWHALEVAQASDFVASMPGQLSAPIDQGGTNVSTGQRQRLCLARALVRRPALYLLDDCFSALDAVTGARLRAALVTETRRQSATVVIVAQRIAAIRHTDQIIVLDAGNIAGTGTHEALLAHCAAYQEIAASQLDEDGPA